jgi:hypothetical protein
MSECKLDVTFLSDAEKETLRREAADEAKKLNLGVSVDDYIDAYKSLNLNGHAAEKDARRFLSDPRRDALGLRHVTEGEVVRMILNSKDQVKGSDFSSGNVICYSPVENKPRTLYLTLRIFKPYFFQRRWESVRMVPVDDLKCEIPYGVLLRMKEIQDTKLFNFFLAFAPTSAVLQRQSCGDPIITTVLLDPPLTETSPGVIWREGTDLRHYLLAQW